MPVYKGITKIIKTFHRANKRKHIHFDSSIPLRGELNAIETKGELYMTTFY